MITTYSAAAGAYQNASKSMAMGNVVAPQSPNPQESGQEADPTFMQLVNAGLNNAIKTEYTGEAKKLEALANKTEMHDLVTAVTNAELTLQTVVTIRDKVISAYHDILKMPI